jgi:hypothetical protein
MAVATERRGLAAVVVICPLLVGPKSLLFWNEKETWNAIQEAQAGGDYRQVT